MNYTLITIKQHFISNNTKKRNTCVLALVIFMWREIRIQKIISECSVVFIYTIIENYVYIDYLACQSKKLSDICIDRKHLKKFPPPRHPRPRPPSGPLTEFQNRLRRNIPHNHILPPSYICPDPIEACFHHCLLQWGVLPTPTPLSPWLLPGEPSRDPVLKNTQGPLHTVGHYPCIRPEQQHRLDHRLGKTPRHLWIRHLTAQNPQQLPPTLPCLLKVAYHYCIIGYSTVNI